MSFFTFWNKEHKDSKLGIMTNVGTNIHKISRACANSCGSTSWLHNVWEMFLLFIKLKFLWKNGVSEKIEAHLPQHSPALQQLFSPHIFNFIQKNISPHPHLKKRAKTMHSIWEITKERQKSYYHSIWHIFYLQNCKVITFEEN